jgi:hypothetical protein
VVISVAPRTVRIVDRGADERTGNHSLRVLILNITISLNQPRPHLANSLSTLVPMSTTQQVQRTGITSLVKPRSLALLTPARVGTRKQGEQ